MTIEETTEYTQATGDTLKFIQAIENGCGVEELEDLWNSGEIDKDARNGICQWTALHSACYFSLNKVNSVVQFLLEQGYDATARTGNGQEASCLIILAEQRRTEALETMLAHLKHTLSPEEYKAEVEYRGGDYSETALEAAETKGHSDCVQLLEEAFEESLTPEEKQNRDAALFQTAVEVGLGNLESLQDSFNENLKLMSPADRKKILQQVNTLKISLQNLKL